MNKVSIIDYGLGNTRSVFNSFEYFGVSVSIATDPIMLAEADRIVLPGVGAFDAAMQSLRKKHFLEPLNELVLHKKLPFLGICLGMQLVMERSEEGNENGLGWIRGRVRRFPTGENNLRVPHIGWNTVTPPRSSTLFDQIGEEDFYFVHSYYVTEEDEAAEVSCGICNYGQNFVAAIERGNILGCQFHPEKSQMAGLKVVENFLKKS